jgi:glycosyltransferase involved in cell wall biosynthesis
MKIAVNTRLLLHNRLEGIGWFAFETLRRITADHPEHEFFFLFDRAFHPEFVFGPNVRPIVLHPQARHPLLYNIWFDYSVAHFLNKTKPDLFLSPDGYLSLRTAVPQLAVIHDLNFEHRPQDLSRTHARYYLKRFPMFARKAARIATVSQFSKDDIVARYGILPDKIDVVLNGASERFGPISLAEQQSVRDAYADGVPYFLFVGSLHPRKNLQTLFPAFDIFKEKTGLPHRLLIVGDAYRWDQSIDRAFKSMKHRADVRLLGRQSQPDLTRLTAAARASVFVSFFEGFGIPIVEAFRCATPVITSDCTSMPEVAGGAALLVNPQSADAIADALTRLATDEAFWQSLSEKGLARSRHFSWDNAARALWESMLKATAQNRG